MISSAPGELKNNHGLGPRVSAEDFSSQSDHVHGSTQHRGLSREIVFDLADEIVAGNKLHIETSFLIDSPGLRFQITVSDEGRDITTPQYVGDLNGLGRFVRP